MPRSGTAILAACLLGVSTPAASAHHGFDCDSSIRLLERQTVLVMKMSPQVLSTLLGRDAPVEWTEEAFLLHRPKLIERAKSFFTIRSGEADLKPVSCRVSRELNGGFAFVFDYPAAGASLPLTLDAEFCREFGPSFQGQLVVRYRPSKPSEREGPVLASMELSPTRRTLVLPSLTVAP